MLGQLPLVDQHAHNLLRPECADQLPYPAFFTEGPPELAAWTRDSLFFQRSLRDLAGLLECEPTEPEVLAARARLGHEGLTRRCFALAGLQEVYLDDGLTPHAVAPLDWHRQFVPVKRLLRLEWLAEESSRGADFELFEERVQAELRTADVVGYKSIAAYRGGLRLAPVAPEEARRAYRPDLQRLTDPALLALLWDWALTAAAERGLPLQLHTGFGDPDLDLALADPLHLRPWLTRHPQARWVLLHAAWPFCRQAGYLASVFPQVYLDFGLAVPFLSVSGMTGALRQLLELAPATKLMYSSDASRIPEMYWLAARWARICLVRVLEECVADGELDEVQAEAWGKAILAENASSLYSRSSGA